MRTTFKVFLSLVVLSFVMFACRNAAKNEKKQTVNEKVTETKKTEKKVDEFKLLATYLKENGDFINSAYCPAMIGAKEVHENLKNPDFLIIDVRKPEHYAEGHIPGAKSVPYAKVVNYFNNEINPDDYESIVLVCYSGQSASYLTSLLQHLGHDNVYAMKFGMSSWNKENAKNFWLKNISDKYVDKLEKKENPKNAPGPYPVLYTGETTPEKILNKRVEMITKDPFKSILVSADEVFNNPEKYYVINYWPKEKYLAGHIPGAVQYTPKKDISLDTYLNTLPVDKPIVIYCYTGQHASQLAAYLNLLGYDARVLKYGANSFMHSILKKNKWHAFTPKKIYNFELEKEAVAQ